MALVLAAVYPVEENTEAAASRSWAIRRSPRAWRRRGCSLLGLFLLLVGGHAVIPSFPDVIDKHELALAFW